MPKLARYAPYLAGLGGFAAMSLAMLVDALMTSPVVPALKLLPGTAY